MSGRVFALFFLMTVLVRGHSLHQSTADAEWNAETKKLEVSLTVFINDLELALMRQSEREMRFEKTAGEVLDGEILKYLRRTFVVAGKEGKKAELSWVGREMDALSAKSPDPAVTLFFEFSLPDGLGVVSVENGVLSDLFADELNLLFLRNGAEKTQMSFKRGEGPKRLVSG